MWRTKLCGQSGSMDLLRHEIVSVHRTAGEDSSAKWELNSSMSRDELPSDGQETDLGERLDRLEEIAETLEDGEVGLETAKEHREEADEHLVAVREELDVGDGEIIEMEAEDAEMDDDSKR